MHNFIAKKLSILRGEVTVGNQNRGFPNVVLDSPTQHPKASGFLWNKQQLLQVNCRGYVNAQFMQPEPAKYAYGPNIEAKTFMQPEHAYYTHHAGRFFYIKDEVTQQIFSLPYEPMRKKLDKFQFIQEQSSITWNCELFDLKVSIKVTLSESNVAEQWSFNVLNLSDEKRVISVYPYFTIGYMSWMNQSARFDENLNAIVATSVTPYQKVEDYFQNKDLKDKTFLVSDKVPVSWHANQSIFEGEGGLHNPDALNNSTLDNVEARYETPVAVMQFYETLAAKSDLTLNFLFGPAKDEKEISSLIACYFNQQKKQSEQHSYDNYMNMGAGCLHINTGEQHFDDFINYWLPRQMYYHGDVHRLTTDPQTRNYVQDSMGMCFIESQSARKAFLKTLSQQHINGAMPDGVLLHKNAQLKYINQIPHADHCVWLPICLMTYLDETADVELLYEQVSFLDSDHVESVIFHIERSLDWLIQSTDERGLSYIEQGDWCDPMNMVGYKGQGVSSWLTLASAYAINTWCDICDNYITKACQNKVNAYRLAAKKLNKAVNQHLWIGEWYARGITDDDRIFGTENDSEGKIFLNPQSWAMLSGAASVTQRKVMINHINQQLMTPHGVMMLAPSYTAMVEDIGRITQKHPGVSENGSVYNHAAIFYAYSLYQQNENDLAFEVITKIIPSMKNIDSTGQLPIFVPNYYRGAYYQFPEQAGRSSQLFNTGTVSWLYRCIVEELVGLKGKGNALIVNPKLPHHLSHITGSRTFRGAEFQFDVYKCSNVTRTVVYLNNELLANNSIENICNNTVYTLRVKVPENA